MDLISTQRRFTPRDILGRDITHEFEETPQFEKQVEEDAPSGEHSRLWKILNTDMVPKPKPNPVRDEINHRLLLRDEARLQTDYLAKRRGLYTDLGGGVTPAMLQEAWKDDNDYFKADIHKVLRAAELTGQFYHEASAGRGAGRVFWDSVKRGHGETAAILAQLYAGATGDKELGQGLHQYVREREIGELPKAVQSIKDVRWGNAHLYVLEAVGGQASRTATTLGLAALPGGAALAGGFIGASNLGEAVGDQYGEDRDLNWGLALGQGAGYTALDVSMGGVLRVGRGMRGAATAAARRPFAGESWRQFGETGKRVMNESAQLEAKKHFIKSWLDVGNEGGKNFLHEAVTEASQTQISRLRRIMQGGDYLEESETIADMLWGSLDEGVAAGLSAGVSSLGHGARVVRRNRAMFQNEQARLNLLANKSLVAKADAYDVAILGRNIGLERANRDIAATLGWTDAKIAKDLPDFVNEAGSVEQLRKNLEKVRAQNEQWIRAGEAVLGEEGRAVLDSMQNDFADEYLSDVPDGFRAKNFDYEKMVNTKTGGLRVLDELETGTGRFNEYTDPGSGVTLTQDEDTGVVALKNPPGVRMPKDMRMVYDPAHYGNDRDAALKAALGDAARLAAFNEWRGVEAERKRAAIRTLSEKLGMAMPETPDSFNDPSLPKSLRLEGDSGLGAIDDDTGKIYINLGRIRTPADALAVLQHEELHKDWTAWRKSAEGQKMFGPPPPKGTNEAADEWLASTENTG